MVWYTIILETCESQRYSLGVCRIQVTKAQGPLSSNSFGEVGDQSGMEVELVIVPPRPELMYPTGATNSLWKFNALNKGSLLEQS